MSYSSLVVFVILVSILSRINAAPKSKAKYPHLPQTNLLFIMFDDMRPELSVYGKNHMITPNFERLAKKSVVFDIAISQVAVCNPSRNSLLTGLRPDVTGGYNFQQSYFPAKLFPEHLINAGYQTAGYGKIRHWDSNDSLWTNDQFDGPIEPHPNPPVPPVSSSALGNQKAAAALAEKEGKPEPAFEPPITFLKWYEYQDFEWRSMKSSVMPDKNKDLDTYPDAVIANRASEQMRNFVNGKASRSGKGEGIHKYWMTGVGFKMPHTALHVPYKYYQMYNDKRHIWSDHVDKNPSLLSFPKNAPPVSFRCCAEKTWRFMNNKGSNNSERSEKLGRINTTLSKDMYIESMQGYSAAVTYADAQLGVILDTLDDLKLWNNVTVVLTADHGMHNGEKAIWEKWSMFDESTRVPLMIAHPKSPFKGTHSYDPVELVDVFPTVLDLTAAPHVRHIYNPYLIANKAVSAAASGSSGDGAVAGGNGNLRGHHNNVNNNANGIEEPLSEDEVHVLELKEPSGKSLAPLVVGHRYTTISSMDHGDHGGRHGHGGHGWHSRRFRDRATAAAAGPPPPAFAISQSIRCAKKTESNTDIRKSLQLVDSWNIPNPQRMTHDTFNAWDDCKLDQNRFNPEIIANQIMLMGYSTRSTQYRYTLWLHFDQVHLVPHWNYTTPYTKQYGVIYAEELYDHRNEELGGLTEFEHVNVAPSTNSGSSSSSSGGGSSEEYGAVLLEQRQQLLDWLETRAVFKNGHLAFYVEEKNKFFACMRDSSKCSSSSSSSSNE